MSFLDGLMGGGGGKWQVKQQIKDNEKRRAFIEQQIAQGRSDLTGGYGAAMGMRNQGYQDSLDVLGQTIPQQFDAFQQGNMAAQSTLLAGLPQYQNAIMGLPVDMSGFSPQSIDYNTDWAQQSVPGMGGYLSGSVGQAPAANPGAGDSVRGDPSINNIVAGGQFVPSGNSGNGNTFSGGQMGNPSSGYYNNQSGSQMGGGGFGLGDTYNATDLEKLFGNKDIGSLNGLNLSEQGGLIGKGVGLLTGLPLMGQLGGWLGQQYRDNRTFMSPVDPNDPYAQQGIDIMDANGNPLITPTNPNQSFVDNTSQGRSGLIRQPYSTNAGSAPGRGGGGGLISDFYWRTKTSN